MEAPGLGQRTTGSLETQERKGKRGRKARRCVGTDGPAGVEGRQTSLGIEGERDKESLIV